MARLNINPGTRLAVKLHRRVCLVLTEDAVLAEELLARKKLAADLAAIDGDIGLTQCSVHVPECSRTTYCPTRPHWAAINRAVGEALAAVTLDAMITPAAFLPRRPVLSTSPETDEPRFSA